MEPPLPLSFPLSPHSAWTISSILLTCIQPMLMILKSVSPGLDFRIQLLTWLLLFPVLEEPQTCHGQAWTPTFPTVLLLFIPHHPIGLTFPQIPRNWATPLNIILPLHVVNRQVMLCPLEASERSFISERCESSPLLSTHQWLPTSYRIKSKTLNLVFKAPCLLSPPCPLAQHIRVCPCYPIPLCLC